MVPLGCTLNPGLQPLPAPQDAAGALDPQSIRLITWNIHKNGDPGWDDDLERFARAHDLVLLQEAHLNPPLRAVLGRSGHHFVLASAFMLDSFDTGVMTASGASPVGACVLRETEPLLQLPKSTVITRFALAGRDETLLVANLHGINFASAQGAYAAQIEAVSTQLERHGGPLVFAGDFNAWTEARRAVVADVMRRLGLVELKPNPDYRRRFFGNQIDSIYVRGLEAERATAYEVRSSDHNPVSAILRLPR